MKIIAVILLYVPLLGIAQSKGLVITGNVAGVKDKTLVYLTDANHPADTIARSTVSKAGFVLKAVLPEPGLFNLNFAGSQKKGLLFLDNNDISVNGNIADVQKLKVEGSATHNDFLQFQNTFNPLFSKLNLLGEQIKATGMTDSLQAKADKAVRDIQAGVDVFLREKNGSPVSPFLLLVTAQLSEDMSLLEKRFASLPETTRKGYYGKFVKEMLDEGKVGAIGSVAIDFTQNDTRGKPVSLSSFKGKYVLIDFWASWCGPCRKENPNVVDSYNKFKNKNFTVLGVSLDRNRESWLKAIDDDGLTWTHVSDLKFWSNEVAQKYKVQSIPQNFLIDPSGKIVGRNLRGPDLTAKLSELLK